MTTSRSRIIRGILALLVLCAAAYASQKTERAAVLRIVDGDTFEIRKQDGTKDRVRLIGVDCPESGRNPKLYRDGAKGHRDVSEIMEEGRLAAEFVRSLLRPGDPVELEYDVQMRDRYGRLLAYAFLGDGRMLNRVLLEMGHASLMTMPPNVKYVEELLDASRHGRGR